MIKLEYFGEKKENQIGHIEVLVKVEHSNGSSINEELKHIVRHSPDGFQIGYGGSGCSDLALSILTDFCERKDIDNSIVEELYQKFKFNFIANCGNKLNLKCKDIANWMIEKKPELRDKLFRSVDVKRNREGIK